MFQGREPEFTFDRARWRRDARREGMVREYLEERCRPGIDPDAHLDVEPELDPRSEPSPAPGPDPQRGHD